MFIVNDIYFLFAQVKNLIFAQVCILVLRIGRFDKLDVEELFVNEQLQLFFESIFLLLLLMLSLIWDLHSLGDKYEIDLLEMR